MSKRIIYQCDKCAQTVEQPDPPANWFSAEVYFASGGLVKSMMWCFGCWNKDISIPGPKMMAASK